MLTLAFNHSTWEVKAGDLEFVARLGFIVRPCVYVYVGRGNI